MVLPYYMGLKGNAKTLKEPHSLRWQAAKPQNLCPPPLTVQGLGYPVRLIFTGLEGSSSLSPDNTIGLIGFIIGRTGQESRRASPRTVKKGTYRNWSS